MKFKAGQLSKNRHEISECKSKQSENTNCTVSISWSKMQVSIELLTKMSKLVAIPQRKLCHSISLDL